VSPPAWRGDFAASAHFDGLREVASYFSGHERWPEVEDLNRVSANLDRHNARGLPLRFEAQSAKCGQRDYETQIHDYARVPTRRESWHDFINALVWLSWPRAKAALNAVQASALGVAHGGRRGARSDAATLFDESGLVLVAPDGELAELLRARRWRAAFWERRPLWKSARLYLVGHALLEKQLAGQAGITGKCLYVPGVAPEDDQAPPEHLDAQVAAAWLDGAVSAPGQLFPVPIQGVPGYDNANTTPEYYDNTRIFRPARAEGISVTSAVST
jgi:hypothetical protein